MVEVIRAAGNHAKELGERPSVFQWWSDLYNAQKSWAAATSHPPLLWNFGVSLIERAMIDAFCRAIAKPFHFVLATGQFGTPEELTRFLLPSRPVSSVAVRHTVGLSDPLTANDVNTGELVNDGLPQTLEESIDAYGLRGFKIKLSGDVAADLDRLRRLAQLFERKLSDPFEQLSNRPPAPYWFTLDGNENFRNVSSFRELWSELSRSLELRPFLSRLHFVEQPFHRDVALSVDLRAWEDRPAIIIDESDADVTSLPRALEIGYHGTSYKSCKGVFKGLFNARRLSIMHPPTPAARQMILSGEDLTNIGPVALLQDLAVLAALGINDAERNAQHYVRGLSQLPDSLQRLMTHRHFDLYHWNDQGFAAVHIKDGRLSTTSVSQAPFGYAIEFDPADYFPRLEDWSLSSLKA
jgi:hypothetical protein